MPDDTPRPDGNFRPPRKVLLAPELMEQWATRDADCNPLTWDWGEPDAEGFYTPTVTRSPARVEEVP